MRTSKKRLDVLEKEIFVVASISTEQNVVKVVTLAVENNKNGDIRLKVPN